MFLNIILSSSNIPKDPCMVSLPTFTIKNHPNVGKSESYTDPMGVFKKQMAQNCKQPDGRCHTLSHPRLDSNEIEEFRLVSAKIVLWKSCSQHYIYILHVFVYMIFLNILLYWPCTYLFLDLYIYIYLQEPLQNTGSSLDVHIQNGPWPSQRFQALPGSKISGKEEGNVTW